MFWLCNAPCSVWLRYLSYANRHFLMDSVWQAYDMFCAGCTSIAKGHRVDILKQWIIVFFWSQWQPWPVDRLRQWLPQASWANDSFFRDRATCVTPKIQEAILADYSGKYGDTAFRSTSHPIKTLTCHAARFDLSRKRERWNLCKGQVYVSVEISPTESFRLQSLDPRQS